MDKVYNIRVATGSFVGVAGAVTLGLLWITNSKARHLSERRRKCSLNQV